MARPIWFVNLIKKAFPDRFRIARLTKGFVLDDVEKTVKLIEWARPDEEL